MSSYSSPASHSPSVSPPVSAAITASSSPTRSRTISAPIATAPGQPLSTISVQVSRLAAQLESEEEEKEESPLSSALASAASNFPSFSARLTAAKRRSPIPRLEIKIESNGEEQGGHAQANGEQLQGKPAEESKEGNVLPAAGGGRVSASSQYAKTPQNSPAAPMTPLAFDTSSAFFAGGGFVPLTPSAASRPRYPNLHSYQPITPAGSPAAPATPGPASSPSYASSPIPVTPTPSTQREYDPPPTPNSASFSRTAPTAFASPLAVAALPPPQRLLTRSVSQGPAPSAQPQRRAYMQDAIPNTPFELEPATPNCTPAPGRGGSEDFTVGLQSIPPSPSPFQLGKGAAERKGWKEPAGVPNTPMSPGGAGWSMPPPSAFSAAMAWPPASPGTLAAIDEVDTPLDRTPTPAPPGQAAAAAASSSYSASALVALSDPVLTPSIAFFLTLIRSLRQSGRISEEQRDHLKEQLMSTSPFFLAAFALVMQDGVTEQTEDELGGVLVALLSPSPSPAAAAALAPVQYQYRFSSLLPITMAEHRALSSAVQRLALHRLPLAELWAAFEAESAFDELTEPAFLSSLHSLLTAAPSSSSSSLPLKQAIAAHLSLYSALRTPRGDRSQYVSFPDYLSSLLCFTSASVTEKTTTVFQLLDADGNNSVAAAQCQRWCEQVCRLLQRLIALSADSADCSISADAGKLLFKQADVTLKGKLSIRKFLAWSNNPVAVVVEMLHTLF